MLSLMAQLVVRKLEEKLVNRLKRRAAQHGISMEEEHRRILQAALPPPHPKPKMNFKEFLLSMPYFGDDDTFEIKRDPRNREVNLGD